MCQIDQLNQCYLCQMLRTFAPTCHQLSQKEMRTDEQHPSQEEVKVDVRLPDTVVGIFQPWKSDVGLYFRHKAMNTHVCCEPHTWIGVEISSLKRFRT